MLGDVVGAVVEAASLNADRSTSGTGLFAVADGTQIKTHTRTWSIYLTDTFSITDELTLTLSGRYNNTSVVIGDRNDRQSPGFGFGHEFLRSERTVGEARVDVKIGDARIFRHRGPP